MTIDYQDLILINAVLQEKGLRYRVSYKNNSVACINPPGECCQTPEQSQLTLQVIEGYYQKKNIHVVFSEYSLFFSLQAMS